MEQSDGNKKKVEKINALFRSCKLAEDDIRQDRKKWAEFFINDVDYTRTQFDTTQREEIRESYNVPISSKYSFPIVEQLVAFLTGLKPYPRLLAASDNVQEFVLNMEEAYQGTWYENKMDDKLKRALTDMFVTGNGFIRVRPNNYFEETTFNVVQDYRPWFSIFVDPDCKKPDLSDAEYVFDVEILRKEKAEKIYDIKIPDSAIRQSPFNDMQGIDPSEDDMIDYYGWFDSKQSKKYVYKKECFEKEEITVYISDTGKVSTKRPIPTEIPNPELLKVDSIIGELRNASQKGYEADSSLQTAADESQAASYSADSKEDFDNTIMAGQEAEAQAEDTRQQVSGINKQIQEYQIIKSQMPKEIPAFEFIDEEGVKFISLTVDKIKKKRIKRTLMVGDYLLEEDYEPCDKYPLIPFVFLFYNVFRRCFGIVHQIHDLIEAINKMISLLITDMQTNNNRKVLYWDSTIVDQTHIEEQWSNPGAWIKMTPDPSLPNGGQPIIVEPSPINQAITHVLDRFLQMIEYITGIYGVIQGNPNSAPETMGATQSLQNFGTQRVKMYARNIEYPLEDLAYVTVAYLQKLAPRDKILMYFDDKNHPKRINIIDDTRDLQFKVRVDISKSLPTIREMQAQLIGMVAAQTKNPYVADLLTQYMLKILDMPEGLEMAEKVDIVKQMEQQIQQLTQQLDAMQKQNNAMTNNMQQKEISQQVELAATKAKGEINTEVALAKEGINNNAEQGESPIIPETEETEQPF